MKCSSKPTLQQKLSNRNGQLIREKYKFLPCRIEKLEDTAREQFFRHYPKSMFPIREIVGSKKSKSGTFRNRGKTEPHIEIGAENYLRACIQTSVRSFCRSNEKYLFLCTTCQNKDIANGSFFGKRFVIGYIEKKGYKDMGDHLAVLGDTYIVPFLQQLEYGTLHLKRTRGMQKFGENDTQRLLKLIHSRKNIRADCVSEMIKLESEARKEGRYIPVDKECLRFICEFQDQCLRKKLR